jgi:hypothetical protein
MFHTAFWVFALFLKCSVLVYASSIAVKKFTHRTKCVVISIVVGVVTVFINEVVGTKIVEYAKVISIIAFALFSVAIPLIYLCVGKVKKVDVIEKV